MSALLEVTFLKPLESRRKREGASTKYEVASFDFFNSSNCSRSSSNVTYSARLFKRSRMISASSVGKKNDFTIKAAITIASI